MLQQKLTATQKDRNNNEILYKDSIRKKYKDELDKTFTAIFWQVYLNNFISSLENLQINLKSAEIDLDLQ